MSQSLSQLQASLQFISGPLAQQAIRLGDQETWIGSDPRSHICIPDQSIQPLHAYLAWDRERLLIGSYQQSLVIVNQQSIADAPHVLANGDIVGLGQAGIAFRVTLHTPLTHSLPQQPSTIHAYQQQSGHLAPPQQHTFHAPHQQSGHLAPPQQHTFNTAHQQSSTSTNLAYTETTRYLCAAAHIDETFRSYVFKNIVREKHRAVGEAYGVDIIPVVKCCFTAEKRTFIRDLILFGFLLCTLFVPLIFGIPTLPFINLFWHPSSSSNACYYSNGQYTCPSPEMSNPLLGMSSMTLLGVGSIAGTIVALLVFFILASLIARLVKLPLFMRNLLCLILLFFFPALLPFCLLAWIVVTVELAITYYGSSMRQLTKGKFRPDAIQGQIDPALDHKLRESFNTQGRNVIVYSGHSPFAGAGWELGGRWSFAIDITQGKKAGTKTLTPENPEQLVSAVLEPQGTQTPLAFQLGEMYDYVTHAIEGLGLSSRSDIRLEDKLYVNGQEIRDDTRFLSNPFAHPYTQIDRTQMREFIERPTENIRYYKCIRVTSWQGELVLSTFFRLVKAGKNLFIEADFLLLSPLKEEYYQIDTLEVTPTIGKIWTLAKLSFLLSCLLLVRSPIRMFFRLFRDWLAQREDERTQRSIRDNPAFDYGASTSLRELASDRIYRRFFQKLDKEMYMKIIEHQMLESIVDFLDARNIDTTELRKRQETILQQTILNSGNIITGGSFSGTSVAAGQAQAASINTQHA